MTPFSKLSPLSYELHSWELEKRMRKIASLDRQLQREHIIYTEAQHAFEEELKAIQARHRKIYETFPLMLQYVKALHHEYKKFGDRAKTSDEKIRKGTEEQKQLQREFVCLRKLDHGTQSRLNSFLIFKQYLENVCEESNGRFKSIPKLLEAFASLGSKRETMFKRIQEARSKRIERKNDLNRHVADSDIKTLKWQNQIGELKQHRNKLETELKDKEEELSRIKFTKSKEILEIGSLRTAVENLYLQVCHRLGRSAKTDPSDLVGQFAFLEIALQDIKELVDRSREAVTFPDTNLVIH